MQKFLAHADRMERAYLGALRVFILVVATLCLIAAAIFAIDSARRGLINTKVEPEPVTVSAEDVKPALNAKPKKVAASEEATTPPWAKEENAAFAKGAFETYYQLYRGLAVRYNKPEDKLLTKSELMATLGYRAEDLASGEDVTSVKFQQDDAYAKSLLATVGALAKDAAVTQKLANYKAAQKTAQKCSTVYEPRRGWDSTSTNCAGWWEYPAGCPVIREVPVEKCVAAYPEGIKSPQQAFVEMDTNYRAIWLERTEKNAAAAAAEAEERANTKAGSMPALLKAGTVLAMFLGVMFLFLVVAVERHLRKLSAAGALTPAPEKLAAE